MQRFPQIADAIIHIEPPPSEIAAGAGGISRESGVGSR